MRIASVLRFAPLTSAYLSARPCRPTSRLMSTSTSSYLAVLVNVKVKSGDVVAFKAASLKNAIMSTEEPGISRFDVLQDNSDPTKFVLNEVYKDASAPAAHKETAHYLEWRETVADMMEIPRSAQKMSVVYPTDPNKWEY